MPVNSLLTPSPTLPAGHRIQRYGGQDFLAHPVGQAVVFFRQPGGVVCAHG